MRGQLGPDALAAGATLPAVAQRQSRDHPQTHASQCAVTAHGGRGRQVGGFGVDHEQQPAAVPTIETCTTPEPWRKALEEVSSSKARRRSSPASSVQFPASTPRCSGTRRSRRTLLASPSVDRLHPHSLLVPRTMPEPEAQPFVSTVAGEAGGSSGPGGSVVPRGRFPAARPEVSEDRPDWRGH